MKPLLFLFLLLACTLPLIIATPAHSKSLKAYCSKYPYRSECDGPKTVRAKVPVRPTPRAPAPPPPTCTTGPLQITSFTWFNSSNNLPCPLPPSDPNADLCQTGKPTQPRGYGPPDYVSFTVLNAATGQRSECIYQNPGSVPAKGEPGRAGTTKCSTGNQNFTFNFVAGPSNGEGGSETAELTVKDRLSRCGRGTAKFALTCSVDKRKNSKCVQKVPKISIAAT